MTLSVRERVLLGGGVTLLIALVGLGLVTYLNLKAALWREFDRSLAAQAHALAANIHFEDASVSEQESTAPVAFGPALRGIIQLSAGERILARSPGLDDPLPKVSTATTVLVGGEPWRTLTVEFHPVVEQPASPPPGSAQPPAVEPQAQPAFGQPQAVPEIGDAGAIDRFHLRLGNQESPYQDALIAGATAFARHQLPTSLRLDFAVSAMGIDHQIDELLLGLVLGGALMTVLGLGALAWILNQALRPMADFATRLGAIDQRSIDRTGETFQPLILDQLPAELVPLADHLNQMLRRLESVVDREKALSADIAHELRTPLTGLRAALDVALRRERDAESYRATLEESRTICLQLQGMVTTLLELARLDRPGQTSGGHPILTDVPLAPAIQDAWALVAERAREREVELICDLVPVQVTIEHARLERVLTNLLENAITYVDPGGRITVSIAVGGGRVRLRVANTGSRISAEDAQRVFDRFWRGDRARAGAGVNAGLGLCLCQRLIRTLGGSITATSVMGGEFVISIDLPGRVIPAGGGAP